MINPEYIHIGSLLRTNKGEIIKVESISTKRQHRKVGYHTPEDPYRIKYVRLAQCEKVAIPITKELLLANKWKIDPIIDNLPRCACLRKDNWYAEYRTESKIINIWKDWDDEYKDVIYADITARDCDTAEKLAIAFQLADIDYKLKE